MTNEEAIEVLKEDNTYIAFESYVPKSCFYEDSSDEIKNMAINAMEKQVVRKPKEAVSSGWCFDWACCNCGRHNRTQFMPAYCNECGQKILLEDEE